MAGQFFEVSGVLGPHVAFGPSGAPVDDPSGRVVLSNLTRGNTESRPQDCICLKYVASGVEVYRYGGRAYSVSQGQFLYVPEQQSGDVEIGRSDSSSTLGLCVYLPRSGQSVEAETLETPMLFPAECSSLGRLLMSTVKQMVWSKPHRNVIAGEALERIANDVDTLLGETAEILDGMDALKASTRYETLRRLNVARFYLHSIMDRPVELAELAKVAGISRFQLLRSFRDAFGAPPAAYHRLLRLKLAKEEIDRKLLSCGEAAHRFGFADCSSFSHAYRRAFGEAPIRSRAAAC